MISLNSYESYFLHEENTTQISIDVSRKLPIAPWTELFLKTEILSDANIIRVHRVICETYKYKIRENLLLSMQGITKVYDNIPAVVIITPLIVNKSFNLFLLCCTANQRYYLWWKTSCFFCHGKEYGQLHISDQ